VERTEIRPILDKLPLGAGVTYSKTISDADLTLWAAVTCSYPSIHIDEEFAKANTPFGRRVGSGQMTSAFMSRGLFTLVQKLGIKTALLQTSAKFIRPVFIGDTITAELKLAEKLYEKGRIRFEVTITNQRGEVICKGEAIEHVLGEE